MSLDAQAGDQQAEGAAREREEGRLGEELADDAAAARAEGRADGDLLAPAERPGEHEVGDVGARDQEDEPDRAEQHQQRRPHVADELLVQRDHRAPQPLLSSGYWAASRAAIAFIWARAPRDARRPGFSRARTRKSWIPRMAFSSAVKTQREPRAARPRGSRAPRAGRRRSCSSRR